MNLVAISYSDFVKLRVREGKREEEKETRIPVKKDMATGQHGVTEKILSSWQKYGYDYDACMRTC